MLQPCCFYAIIHPKVGDTVFMLPILLFFILVFARMSTCYDSRISKCKYITVKNNTLAKILIEKESFFDKGKYTPQKDRNKMSIVGLIFYLCVIFIVALTLFFCLLPKIPCEPFEFDATKMYLYADTLNQKIPIILSIILLCSEVVYFTVSLFQYKKEIEQKWIRILVCVSTLLMGLVSSIVILEMLFELLKW